MKCMSCFYQTPYYLSRAFASLPSTVEAVDLSLNSFYLKTAIELKEILASFKRVKSVNLSDNGLSAFTRNELVDIISSMESVTEITLNEKTWPPAKSEELANFLHQATKKIIITKTSQKPFLFMPFADPTSRAREIKPLPSHDQTLIEVTH